MFSTSQSKAFFSQQIIKGKLISQQIQLVNNVYDRILESKLMISEIIKIACQDQKEKEKEKIAIKLNKVNQIIDSIVELVQESNQSFSFQINLRYDIKQLQHKFFKQIMIVYQERIKQLKHWLLMLESQVQDLQQKGLLPYVQNPMKNNMMASKLKNFQSFKQKLQLFHQLIDLTRNKKIQKLASGIVDSIINKKQSPIKVIQILGQRKIDFNFAQQKLDKSYEFCAQKGIEIETPGKSEKVSISTTPTTTKVLKKQQNGVLELLKLLQNWTNVINFRLKQENRNFKSKIQLKSTNNKKLKQGIRLYKKILKYQQNQAMVRAGNNQMSRQQSIDFLRQMNEDLQRRFTCRNIYMIVSCQPNINRICSCKNLNIYNNPKPQDQNSHAIKQININLNNSFLDQCSYLISDRFEGEDQNQEMIV